MERSDLRPGEIRVTLGGCVYGLPELGRCEGSCCGRPRPTARGDAITLLKPQRF